MSTCPSLSKHPRTCPSVVHPFRVDTADTGRGNRSLTTRSSLLISQIPAHASRDREMTVRRLRAGQRLRGSQWRHSLRGRGAA